MRSFLFFIFFISSCVLFSQITSVTGEVRDAKTGDLLPFVNVSFQGSKIGTSTDINGFYKLESSNPTDTLVVSFVGYNILKKKILKGRKQVVPCFLESSEISLDVVVVSASRKDDNPAHAILKRVIENKALNDREKLESYQYETYNKIEFAISNVKESMYKNKRFNGLRVIENYIDSSNGRMDLPMFITESMSDFYYRKSPNQKREFIKASHISGVQNTSVSQFLGDMYQNINVYDNVWVLFNQSFSSPINDLALWSYKFYLVDSAFIDGNWCYRLDFIPKREQENSFSGHLWIHDTTYAVKSFEAVLSKGANINWVKRFAIKQEYKQVQQDIWMLSQDELMIDFELSESSPGIVGHKTSCYRDFVVNKPQPDEFYEGTDDIIVVQQEADSGKKYLDAHRHLALNKKEAGIYEMIDTVQHLPVYRTVYDLVRLIVSGYKRLGLFELGPYYTFYSYNPIEGNRFRFGGRTTSLLYKHVMLEGYLAYGLKDKNFKYCLGGQFFITQKPRQILGLYYRKDLEQLGQGIDSWRQDNIMSSVFRRNPATRLNGFEEYLLSYKYEWFYGLMNTLELRKRSIWPLGQLQFQKNINDVYKIQVPNINTFELSLTTRFAYQEKYVAGTFNRVSLGTKWPVFYLTYSLGLKHVLSGQYNYQRVVFRMQDYIHIHPIGYSVLVLESGKVFGSLPYPLLEVHNGNETYSYDNTAFNLMNFYEFVSDQYASISLTQHFNGFLFNKIPLFKKLKWREIAQFRSVYGSFHPNNLEHLSLPITTSYFQKNKPYAEAGVGVENIFKFLRLDLLWRLTYIDQNYVQNYQSHLNSTNIARWGIRGTIQIVF